VKSTFNNGPGSKQLGYELLDIDEAQEISSSGIKVQCKAIGYTNAGRIAIVYEFIDRGDGRYWIEVRPDLSSAMRDLSSW
jgi:hypothetical protein